jgi:hypothetical protein
MADILLDSDIIIAWLRGHAAVSSAILSLLKASYPENLNHRMAAASRVDSAMPSRPDFRFAYPPI